MSRQSAVKLPDGRSKLVLAEMDLPRFSSAIVDVLRVANDPDASTNQLGKVIMRDQAMTVRVLSVANSPVYGCPRKVESVRQAISLLGTKQVQNIASALAVGPHFASPLGPGLWRHAVACALWSDRVAQHMGLGDVDSLFTAALMHDIGIVILLHHAPDREQLCLARAEQSGRPLDELEREELGLDHAELGAQACRKWQLPERICHLIEVHEQLPTPDDRAAGVLALADIVARDGGMPEFPWMLDRGVAKDSREHALAACKLATDDIDRILSMRAEVEAEVAALA